MCQDWGASLWRQESKRKNFPRDLKGTLRLWLNPLVSSTPQTLSRTHPQWDGEDNQTGLSAKTHGLR